MNKSEVERHKMYEHPVPVSPFEDKLTTTTTTKKQLRVLAIMQQKMILLRRQLLVEGEYRSNL
jgi:hypothetical protein